MAANKQHKYAEDYLLEDLADASNADGEDTPSEELLLAKTIRKSVIQQKASLDLRARGELESRIFASIKKERKPLRSLIWLSSAAMLVVALSLTVYVRSMRESGIREFAGQVSYSITSGNTRLIIPQQEDVEIESTDSKIDYALGNNQVQINASGRTQNKFLASASNYNTLVVPYGKRSRITLPDNTIVWLNSGSQLTYPVRFDKNLREVYLQGEALFEVNHNAAKPFYVLTRKMDVKVLGTVFNLSAYDNDSLVSTVLVKGSVELRHRSAIPGLTKTEKMVPGMQAVYRADANIVVQKQVDTRQYTSWKDGYLIFENSSLGDIATKLERYYNVRIQFEKQEMKNDTFSGNLDLGESALDVLKIITAITGADVVNDGNVIRIMNKSRS